MGEGGFLAILEGFSGDWSLFDVSVCLKNFVLLHCYVFILLRGRCPTEWMHMASFGRVLPCGT